MTLLHRLRSVVRWVLRRNKAEQELDDELQTFIDMAAAARVQEGVSLAEARRRARLELGGLEQVKERVRDARSFRWLDSWWLDLKRGLRMLAKYPGLTIVGGLAMAFGIGVGVAGYEGLSQLVDPTLPLEDGRRIVGVRTHNVQSNRSHRRTAFEFARWRHDITLIEEIAAFSDVSSNLIIDGAPEPVDVAQMTASGFRVARVPALLGRTLFDTDESGTAPAVAVIGFDLWQRRFSADPAVVGRTVQLGREHVTVVGIMPEGFAFPVAHGMWIPFRRSALEVRADEGPELLIFGRLAPGVTREQADAELLLTASRGVSTGSTGTHEFLRPRVVPFASLIIDPRDFEQVRLYANGFLVMLLALACANVALLIFTRTTARQGEFALRNALGASRRRIVGQLFVEALVLSLLAVTIGLAGARSALSSYWLMYEADSGRPLPFWIGNEFSPTTMLYAALLTVLAAVIISVLPALRVTGRGRLAQLRQSTAGGGGYQFGGAWTVVFVAQVAITLAFPVVGFYFHRWVVLSQTRDLGFPAQEFLSARLEFPPDELDGRRSSTLAELGRQLASDPGVLGVTFANRLPGTQHERARMELDDDIAPPVGGYVVHAASVDLHFFEVLGANVRLGRRFTSLDGVSRGSGAIIVNESFEKDVMKGRNPLGQRIRRMARGEEPSGRWLEIVGVVPDLGIGTLDEGGSGMYALLDADATPSVHAAVRTRGTPGSLTPRLRTLAARVHPALAINDVAPLPQAAASTWLESQYVARLLISMSAIALLLSLTAIYSVMAVTVARRTREIGIRIALGAQPRRVIWATFRRPIIQLSLGVVTGAGAAALVAHGMSVGLYGVALMPHEALLIVSYAAAMMAVCLVACIVPTRRALRLAPADVLRAEA